MSPPQTYTRIVPSDSFIGRYLRYMHDQETAYIYDVWCALWCLSTAVGRHNFVERPRAPIYLNMFLVLVGESGVTRKSTSVGVCRQLIRPLLQRDPTVVHIDTKITPERLDQLLMERTIDYGHAHAVVTCPELAVFMGTENYIAHMPTMLTDLYDCPRYRVGGGTIARGSILQENVWVNVLSASTPVWLLKSINPNVIEGGFTSRTYFVVGTSAKRKIAWPEKGDTDLLTDMCDDLIMVSGEARTRDPIKLGHEGMKRFTQWYQLREHSIDPFKQTFEAREDAHVLRIAALLAINDGSWYIKRSHVGIAIRLITALKNDSGAIFETAEARSKFAAALDVLRSQLMSAGLDPMLRSQLFQKVRHHVSYHEFITLIEVMHEIRCIQRFEVRTGDRGRPAEWIRGTNLLLAHGIGQSVLERLA